MKTIKLDKERPILVNMNALEAFEDMVGKPFGDINAGSMKEMKALLYCVLKEADPNFDLTLQQVGAITKPNSLKDVYSVLKPSGTEEGETEGE